MSYMKQLWIEREQARAEAYPDLELDLEEGRWPELKRPKLTEKMLNEHFARTFAGAFKAPSLKKLEKYFQTIGEEQEKRAAAGKVSEPLKGSPDIIFVPSPRTNLSKDYSFLGPPPLKADKPKVDVDASLRKQRDAQLRRIFT